MTKPRFTLQETNALSQELIQTIKMRAVRTGIAKDLSDYSVTNPFAIGYLEGFLADLMRDNPELVAEVQNRIRFTKEQA